MNRWHTKQEKQAGAVSLFVVIFAALLMTVVTVSFVQFMLRDQQQATTNDLSQSANDAALAGVEDAKRLLLLDQSCRDGTAAVSVNCTNIQNALAPLPGTNETDCNPLVAAGLVGQTNDETIVQRSVGDNAAKLDQAYTCVKVIVNTEDYKKKLDKDQSILVPITGAGTFDRVEVSWFSRSDVEKTTDSTTVGFPTTGADVSLPRVGTKWQLNYPPLLRTQLIQLGGSFSLTDFNDSQPGNKSDANTLFLYPSAAGTENKDFALDARKSPTNTPQQVRCDDDFLDAEYVCKATIMLPSPIDGNVANRNAFLRLTALYNGAHFKVKLKNGSDDVRFDRVQPEVDATGRANDIFRRVKARVELKGDFIYPEAALDIIGDLCKNFTVTDTEGGYSNDGACTP
jgi:Tfp pilus assembly protein PilX